MSTGHADDDEVLRQIARLSPLDAPRDWSHFVYCQDESAARAAAARITAAGWAVQILSDPEQGPGWCVIAEQHGVITSADAVRRARIFFEGVAAGVAGGDYDGWHASA